LLDILFSDAAILVLNKPAALPMTPDKTGDDSLLSLAEKQFRQQLHAVHRIDRPASGIVLLARSPEAMAELSRFMQQRSIEKTYLAVVQGIPPVQEGRLVHFLTKNEAKNKVFASEEPQSGAERAELEYRVIGSGERYHLLEIQLHTGRHHQIRAQLAAIGCPIKGDVKYGARRNNPDRSIHLHAWKISFEHPFSGEILAFEAPVPQTDGAWKINKSNDE
jgi:23S rRNA pseudouridine1911/1915/1917 synthase